TVCNSTGAPQPLQIICGELLVCRGSPFFVITFQTISHVEVSECRSKNCPGQRPALARRCCNSLVDPRAENRRAKTIVARRLDRTHDTHWLRCRDDFGLRQGRAHRRTCRAGMALPCARWAA